MNPSLKALENQYVLLTNSLPNLIADCKGDKTLTDSLMSQYVMSRRNYWAGIGKIFHNDDPAVQTIVTQMTLDQLSLEATIAQLGNIAKIINAISKAVEVGGALAAKAVAV